MSTYDECATCGKFDFLDSHRCPPQWQVMPLDYDDEWEDARRIYAPNAEAAAEEWAERDDWSSDYTIVGGNDAVVRVRKVGDVGAGQLLVVSGETVPQYNAQPARRLGCPRCGHREDLDDQKIGETCPGMRGNTEQPVPCGGKLEPAA